MRPVWHPLSALLLPDAPAFASPALVRMVAGGSGSLRYAGDRMWPAVRHGDEIECLPPGEVPPRAGECVVARVEGVPDLLRVVHRAGDGGILLAADADPEMRAAIPVSDLLARTRLPARRALPGLSRVRRMRLDLREARRGRWDPRSDGAETVREKYDSQARFYAGSGVRGLPETLLDLLRSEVPAGSSILVAGSGAGRECFELAAAGWRVAGVDFSPPMVEAARSEAERRRLDVPFHLADLRSHAEPDGSLGAIVFTYDVYSFLPEQRDRIDLLRRMRGFLCSGGVILLSARRLQRAYEAGMLTLQQLAARRRGERRPWGASHTRWITPDGNLHRSFVQVFRRHRLEREIRRAGLRPGEWLGGHCVLRTARGAA